MRIASFKPAAFLNGIGSVVTKTFGSAARAVREAGVPTAPRHGRRVMGRSFETLVALTLGQHEAAAEDDLREAFQV